MGIKEMGFFLIMLFCSHLLLPASSSPLHQTLFSGFVQKKVVGDKGMNEMSTTGGGGQISSVNRRGGGGGGGHGGGRGSGGHGGATGKGNGESTTPNTKGNAAFIPIYAGGAVNSHHNHYNRNAASRNGGYVSLTTLGATILASLVLQFI